MHRPLETTFWIRLKQFLKGAFLYNTIYWRRASDDLEIQRMSREERASLRPKRNLEIIRPRERPRAATGDGATTLPSDYGERSDVPPLVQISEPPAPPPLVPAARLAAAPAADEDPVEIHKRKKRRRSRHSSVMPKQYYETPAARGGVLGWLFRK